MRSISAVLGMRVVMFWAAFHDVVIFLKERDQEVLMPRRRPIVGNFAVDGTTWGPAGQPPNQFTLTFDNALFDYTYDPGGGNPPVALDGQTLFITGGSPPTVREWEGLAQPSEIQCRHTGTANFLPPDFECSFVHSHERWANVDELGDGGFRGLATGVHHHVFRMDEWALVEVEIVPGVPETRWFAPHKH
jgi:hypothetical protein